MRHWIRSAKPWKPKANVGASCPGQCHHITDRTSVKEDACLLLSVPGVDSWMLEEYVKRVKVSRNDAVSRSTLSCHPSSVSPRSVICCKTSQY